MSQLLQLQGVPKIYLRNSIPVKDTKKFVDDYELTLASPARSSYPPEFGTQHRKAELG